MLNKLLHTSPRTRLIATLSILIVGVLIGGIVFLATHGRLVVKAADGVEIESASYCELTCYNASEIKGSSALLSKGEYSVSVKMTNGTSYMAQVTIGGFLSATTVQSKSAQYALTGFATGTDQYILPLDNGYLTYDPDAGSTVTGASFPAYINSFSAAGYVEAHKLALVESVQSDSSGVSVSGPVLLYDTQTKAITNLGTIESSIVNSGNVYYGSDSIYVLDTTGSQAKIFQISANGIKKIAVPTAVINPGSSEIPVFAANNGRLAVASSSNKPNLTIYSLSDFSVIKQIPLTISGDATVVSLSPDGLTAVVLITEKPAHVYNVATGEEVFRIPAGDFVNWVDNNTFVYQPDADRNNQWFTTLSVVNHKSKELYSIVSNDVLKVGKLSMVVDNKVYFTGIPKMSTNSSNTKGYVVDLKTTTSQTTLRDTSIIKSLPYDGMTYNIGYHFDQNSQLILDVTAASGARNSAIKEIADLGFDPGDYTIVFKDYLNPFGNTEGGNQ